MCKHDREAKSNMEVRVVKLGSWAVQECRVNQGRHRRQDRQDRRRTPVRLAHRVGMMLGLGISLGMSWADLALAQRPSDGSQKRLSAQSQAARSSEYEPFEMLVAKLDPEFSPIEINDQIAKSEHWLCRIKDRSVGVAVRSLRIYQTRDGGCRATYTKGSSESLVGVSRDPRQCSKIVESIRNNLVAGSWTCRQASLAGQAFSRKLESEVLKRRADAKGTQSL